MIPQAYITEWADNVPWKFNEQVEQDLIISRALVEIFSDKFLGDTTSLLRPDEIYEPMKAYISLKKKIVERM